MEEKGRDIGSGRQGVLPSGEAGKRRRIVKNVVVIT
jgi:hypothetical protein